MTVRAFFVLALGAVGAGVPAHADFGGIAGRGTTDGVAWTLYAENPSLEAGPAEFSVLLGAESGDVLIDAEVLFRLEAPDRSVQIRKAQLGFGSNFLLFGAPFYLHEIGDWRLMIDVALGERRVRIETVLDITPAPSVWRRASPWLILPALVILLYLVGNTRRSLRGGV